LHLNEITTTLTTLTTLTTPKISTTTDENETFIFLNPSTHPSSQPTSKIQKSSNNAIEINDTSNHHTSTHPIHSTTSTSTTTGMVQDENDNENYFLFSPAKNNSNKRRSSLLAIEIREEDEEECETLRTRLMKRFGATALPL